MWRKGLYAVFICLGALLLVRASQLLIACMSPVDTYLVLGGTPHREIFVAQLVKQHPGIKVLISGGSEDPCIWLMFDKEKTPKDNVWMESCSKNTFENFYYSAPILNRLGARKVLLITDISQSGRALPMAQIMLGAKGMCVELQLVPNSSGEISRHPLALDLALSVGWAIVSEVWEPHCAHVTYLPTVDMAYWNKKGFYCAPQAEVGHDH